jgi:hypothetical protein
LGWISGVGFDFADGVYGEGFVRDGGVAWVAVQLEDGGLLTGGVGFGHVQQADEEGLAFFEADVDLLLVTQTEAIAIMPGNMLLLGFVVRCQKGNVTLQQQHYL